MQVARKTVAGHWQDPHVAARIAAWARAACAWREAHHLKVARFGDTMRNVADTEGDKVEAQIRLGVAINGYGVGDLTDAIRAVPTAAVDDVMQQDDMRWRRHRLIEGLSAVYPHLPAGVRMFLEYKLYEPALYSTDVQDWGQSPSVCLAVGEMATVCVDTGHHAMGVNIEQIVAILLAEGRLGGFDLNDKKYGDDDLMVGSIDPYQLFRIAHELVSAMRDDGDPVAQRCANETVYMLDQCHNIEPKIPALIRSVMNLQEAMAKALLVDREAIVAAQAVGDVLEANRLLADAFATDVRPLLADLRVARGLAADPYRAYLESGEGETRAAARAGGVPAGWG